VSPSNLFPKHNGEEHKQHRESVRLGNAARTSLKQPGRCGALSTMARQERVVHTTCQNGIVFLTASRLEDGFRLCSYSMLHSLEVNPTPRNFKIRDTRRRRAKCKKLGGHSAH